MILKKKMLHILCCAKLLLDIPVVEPDSPNSAPSALSHCAVYIPVVEPDSAPSALSPCAVYILVVEQDSACHHCCVSQRLGAQLSTSTEPSGSGD